MEIPLATVTRICALAMKHRSKVLLNVAPAREIEYELVSMVDILVVNETEIEKISGRSIDSMGEETVIDTVLAMGARTVILTLGRRGCIVKSDGEIHFIPAFEVLALDTTAAGDTFCGALVAQLSKGKSMLEAAQFATAASAICVTRMGAQPSIPTEKEVALFLRTNPAIASDGVPKSVNKDSII
jgi:ribokinase